MKIALSIPGRQSSWTFFIEGSASDLRAWRADGLEVDPVEDIIPADALHWARAGCSWSPDGDAARRWIEWEPE
jgi:hypothetical protein